MDAKLYSTTIFVCLGYESSLILSRFCLCISLIFSSPVGHDRSAQGSRLVHYFRLKARTLLLRLANALKMSKFATRSSLSSPPFLADVHVGNVSVPWLPVFNNYITNR